MKAVLFMTANHISQKSSKWEIEWTQKKRQKNDQQWHFWGDFLPNFDLSSMFGYALTFLH
jgi:hypothetical protein